MGVVVSCREADALSRAAEVLAGGGLVAFPTETYYGLAADLAQASALARLADLKGREANKPFPLIAADMAQALALAAEVPALARELMARHWPGPLTLVLTARSGLPREVVSPDGGVGVRVSPHPVAGGLARALGRPITATSANPAGLPPARRVEELHPRIVQGVDLVLEGGATPGGPASTVLDVRRQPPRLLRAGPVEVAGAERARRFQWKRLILSRRRAG